MPPRQPAAARAPPPRGRKAPAARAGPRLRLGRPRPRAHRKNPARTGPQPPTRRQRVTASMTTGPHRDRSGRELAERLQITPRNLHTQLGEWAKLGFITRTGFATYALNTPPADTPSTTAPDP